MPKPPRIDQGADSVRHVHAGNKFHFRWAARRCLRLLDPQTGLSVVKVEGSREADQPGECVIDISEYYRTDGRPDRIAYFQLKHSSTQPRPVLNFSAAADTLKDFAKRHRSLRRANATKTASLTFHLVTNRQLSPELISAVAAAHLDPATKSKGMDKLRKATGLKGVRLQEFAKCIVLNGAEGDYRAQRDTLQTELSEFLVGFPDDDKTRRIVDLVEEKALPGRPGDTRHGEITRENVLAQYGIDNPRKLFPARPVFEKLAKTLRREQHDELLLAITSAPTPLIIEAEGGVGKSVVARELAKTLPPGSRGVVYDCFGAGKYRNANEPRHLPEVVTMELANELAEMGLCRIMLPVVGNSTAAYYDALVERIKEAAENLEAMHPGSQLVIFIDAADNAVIAAELASETCFVEQLWRLPLPPSCRLVMLCRPERTITLKAPPSVRPVSLRPFSEAESLWHLRRVFPKATTDDGIEFHRLSSNGNPRVQSVVLAVKQPTVRALLDSLGKTGQTVAAQINSQLEQAIARENELQGRPDDVSAICHGLANLPPFIPLKVLATAANVQPATIRSLVSGLGRAVWFDNDSVQFRDEPTETWFRESFAARPEQIGRYADSLKPLAEKFTYVAKALPELLEKAGRYDDVIQLALSPDGLPANSPIDQRDVRVYRLRYAFKAALKRDCLPDAVKIAFLAGEETAGSGRQLKLLSSNVDLVSILRDAHQVQQLAQSGELGREWDGSGSVYEASLLSRFPSFRAEARNRLHASRRWLDIYFAERDRAKKAEQHWNEKLETDDIIEMVWTVMNLFGGKQAVRSMETWSPKPLAFPVMSAVVHRLVDAGRFDELETVADVGAGNVYIAAAVAQSLMAVGRLPKKKQVAKAVAALGVPARRPKLDDYRSVDKSLLDGILCLLEAAVPAKLPRPAILRVLRHYVKPMADSHQGNRYTDGGRTPFMRAVALRVVLEKIDLPKPEALILAPKKKPSHRLPNSEEKKEILDMLGALLPWYHLRMRLIAGDEAAQATDLVKLRNETRSGSRYHHFDRLPIERSIMHFECLLWKKHPSEAELTQFIARSVDKEVRKFLLADRLRALRAVHRSRHLQPLADPLEQACLTVIKASHEEPPSEQADSYILLCRALLAARPNDASAYFKDAVEIVSRFGDEVGDRWQAVTALAKRAASAGQLGDEVTFGYLRVAELVGSSADDKGRDWDKNGTLDTAFRMSPATAWAASARWQDREVNWSVGHHKEAALSAMRLGLLTPAAAWCSSGFGDCHNSGRFHAECIRLETDKVRQNRMLEQAVSDMARDTCTDESWNKIAKVATDCGLSLASMYASGVLAPKPAPVRAGTVPLAAAAPDVSDVVAARDAKWEELFATIDLFDPASLTRGKESIQKEPAPRYPYEFWPRVLKRVPAGRELDFLGAAVKSEALDYGDACKILAHAQDEWQARASIRREWSRVLFDFGRRFARSVANSNRLIVWHGNHGLSEATFTEMRKGMLVGLTEASHDIHAVTFFGFIENAAPSLPATAARGLLDFALTRFQPYLAPDFADGPYSPALTVTADPVTGYAGKIWSALASPGGKPRWEAAHCVRRLVEMQCVPEIDALVAWMQSGKCGAFGAPRFPFYALHAQLYLFVAFARGARTDATALRKHAATFATIALDGPPHILIQKFAAGLALQVEHQFPGTLPAPNVARLKEVGLSPLPPRDGKRYDESDTDLPAAMTAEAADGSEFNFGMDFESDWLHSLGRVFGLHQKQVEALARSITVHSLSQRSSKEYQRDPRRDLWANEDRGTYIHHHSYPRTDDHQFYAAYHTLMIAAARFLAALPVIRNPESPSDEWAEWLESHLLTRLDGTWLSDRRDPSPPKERDWVHRSDEKDWPWLVQPADFADVLCDQSPVKGWLVAWGVWDDCRHYQKESMHVTSALVHPLTSESLATSLRWSEPYRYYVPLAGRNDSDRKATPPFDLVGWISQGREPDDSRDTLDPYAKAVSYPPLKIAGEFMAGLKLESDAMAREWTFIESRVKAALSEVWSEGTARHREAPRRSGARLSVSPELLRRICELTGRHILFSVQIGRSVPRDSDGYHDSPPRSHQIFIFTPDGQLHGEKTSIRIG